MSAAYPDQPPHIAAQIEALDEDDRYLFEERAAIREYMAGTPRPHAEVLALRDVAEASAREDV